MVGKSKQSSFTHELASLLVYELLDGNTGIAIFMPTSKSSLPVTCSSFLPVFDFFQFITLFKEKNDDKTCPLQVSSWVNAMCERLLSEIMLY